MARVLVAYASGTGCNSACAVDIANEIAEVPDLEVDVKPLRQVRSIDRYSSVYIGWVTPSESGRLELERFLNINAPMLPNRAVWIVHHHPTCDHGRTGRPMKLTRLVATAQATRTSPAPQPSRPPAQRSAPAFSDELVARWADASERSDAAKPMSAGAQQ